MCVRGDGPLKHFEVTERSLLCLERLKSIPTVTEEDFTTQYVWINN